MDNIYQLSQELLNIFDIIEENGGEITPEIEENLKVTEQSFNNKIKDYINVVKYYKNDINLIKSEIERLKSLQESKEKTIERINKIIIDAISTFGKENKNGNKYIDYGTGKISIRTLKKVEVDDDAINDFANRYIAGLVYFNMHNQLDTSILKSEDIIKYANTSTEEGDINLDFTINDIEKIDANIDVKLSFKELISNEKGFNLIKTLINYGIFKLKASVNKNNIKEEFKQNNNIPKFARIIDNKTLLIK